MAAGPDPSPRTALALACLALLVTAASVLPQLQPNTWIFRDGRFYVNVATTITEDLTLDQHRFAGSWYSGTLGWNRDLDPGWSNVALGAHGEHFPKHPWIHPLLASPAYYAFGLQATLWWNVMMFAFIAAGLFRFARDYTRPAHAALASALFVFATIIVGSAYDFSVDVLMLAFFAQALAAISRRQGALAGVLVGLCVIIKPTALMLLPSLALLLFERRASRELLRSLGSGTVVLAIQAALNTIMYGRPWWSGYNRTLVTHHGEPTVADHADAFAVPLDEGLARTWSGYYGLSHTFTVLALGAPGLLVLLKRKPLTGLATILGVTLSILVFSKYAYEGHRFHWPALALLVPSLALTLELAGDALERARLRIRASLPGAHGPALAAGIAVAGACAAILPFGPSIEARAGSGPWVDAMRELGLAPHLLVGLHLVLAAALAAALVRIVARVTPAPIAAFAAAAPAMLTGARESILAGGPSLVTLLLAALAAERASLPRRAGEDRGERSSLVRHAPALVLALLAAASLALPGAGEGPSLLTHALDAIEVPLAAARLLLPIGAAAVVGIGLALRRDPALALALGALTALAAFLSSPASGGAALLVLAAPSALVADAMALAVTTIRARLDARRGAMALAAVLVVLLSIGTVRNVSEAAAPFRAATHRGALHAVVMLGDVPCDFMAWEHMSWECSHFDSGLYDMVGLALSEPPHVGGVVQPLMLVPSGRGRTRSVAWEDVPARSALVLRWAVPDGHRGDVVLHVEVDDEEVARVAVPAEADGELHVQRIPTPGLEGGHRLAVRVEPVAGRRGGVVALDLAWQ